jgi:predicted nucleotidyltransferase
MASLTPTPYHEVNDLLQELLASMQAVLGDQLIAVYLDGSLASGDFDEDSDIDFVAVTTTEISEGQFLALKAMHERISAIETPLAIQLEGTYISRDAIRRYDPRFARHANIERGQDERLKWVHLDGSWIVHRSVLRERGITLVGPAPQTLIDPILPGDLRQAMQATLDGWVTQLSRQPDYLKFRGYQSYIVLTLCRILFTLENGQVVSKPAAAKWAQTALGEPWVDLIGRAWVGRHHPDLEASPADVDGTMALIHFTLERGQQNH